MRNGKWKMENDPFLTCKLAALGLSFGDWVCFCLKHARRSGGWSWEDLGLPFLQLIS
jgi:hypothetical protein